MKTLVNALRRAVILSAVCAIAVAAAAPFARAQTPPAPRTVLEQRVRAFLDELNLTDEQKTRLEAVFAEERPALLQLLGRLVSAQAELRAATRDGRFDEAEVRALVGGLTPTVVELIVTRERILSKIYAVLTAEQRALFELRRDELFAEFDGFVLPTGGAGGDLLQDFITQLGLSQGQQLAVLLVVAPEFPGIEARAASLSEAEEQLRAATAGGRFDDAQVRAIATRQAHDIGELTVIIHRVLSKIYAVLNPAQRAQAESLLDEFAARLRALLDSVSIDDPEFFVAQHYRDFLLREADAPGLAFWTNQITECGADAACREVRTVNVSAAFFLSIEFQQTGVLAYLTHKAAFGNLPAGAPVPVRHADFRRDTQALRKDYVFGQPGSAQQLEANKQAFFGGFVSRPEFVAQHPTSLTPGQFVDALYAKAGITPTGSERSRAINRFEGAANSADAGARAAALRQVAEDPAFAAREKNRAFVLMQYFGYLQRDPDEAGYNFWLKKLDEHHGDFIAAEMVRSFITSGEYRGRFGQ
ncbi:MAG TPA: Spy/CpxP family protein refolding chaperone [Pyrinomonadaceae bacterium]|nr:Spy/CpxP family protein refolding chaperone [Pyrinomonadaceae bacterium]